MHGVRTLNETDAIPSRRCSYEERVNVSRELITIKPSTELIPDEYEHEENKKVLVHIFRSRCEDDVTKEFITCLEKLDYEIPEKHIHYLDKKEKILHDLSEISKDILNIRALFILCTGECNSDYKNDFLLHEGGTISTKDIWCYFLNNECAGLINIPKIFIFLTSDILYTNNVVTDSTQILDHGYGLPAEADILLVYKHFEESSKIHFMEQFCENIKKQDKRDDIIDLITQTDYKNETRPVIISTLTRKFYLTSSKMRGHNLELHESNINFKKDLKNINNKFDEMSVKNSRDNYHKGKILFKKNVKSTNNPISSNQINNTNKSTITTTDSLSANTNTTTIGSPSLTRRNRKTIQTIKKPVWKP